MNDFYRDVDVGDGDVVILLELFSLIMGALEHLFRVDTEGASTSIAVIVVFIDIQTTQCHRLQYNFFTTPHLH